MLDEQSRTASRPNLWTLLVGSLRKGDEKKTNSGFESWFEQLREDGLKLGIEVEPMTMWERIFLEQDAQRALFGRPPITASHSQSLESRIDSEEY